MENKTSAKRGGAIYVASNGVSVSIQTSLFDTNGADEGSAILGACGTATPVRLMLCVCVSVCCQ